MHVLMRRKKSLHPALLSCLVWKQMSALVSGHPCITLAKLSNSAVILSWATNILNQPEWRCPWPITAYVFLQGWVLLQKHLPLFRFHEVGVFGDSPFTWDYDMRVKGGCVKMGPCHVSRSLSTCFRGCPQGNKGRKYVIHASTFPVPRSLLGI